MKACKLTFSVELLLNLLGLEQPGDLRAFTAFADEDKRTVTLHLTGDHPALPDVRVGEDIPEAEIICTRIQSKLVVHKAGESP